MITTWFFGFHAPSFRAADGRISFRRWWGHCEAWGVTGDDTWLFLDPMGRGTHVRVCHRLEEVQDQIEARLLLCDMILTLPARDPAFQHPFHGLLTCASVCGHLVGIRAFAPATLRRKLLANGAEIIHEQTQGREFRGQGSPLAGAPDH